MSAPGACESIMSAVEGVKCGSWYQRPSQITPHTTHPTTPHPTPHTPHSTLHTPHLAPHTPHSTPHTSHPTHHTLHLTLHSTPHTSPPTPYTSHPTPHTLHLTPHTSRLTPHTSHPTPHTPHPTSQNLHRPHRTPCTLVTNVVTPPTDRMLVRSSFGCMNSAGHFLTSSLGLYAADAPHFRSCSPISPLPSSEAKYKVRVFSTGVGDKPTTEKCISSIVESTCGTWPRNASIRSASDMS